MWYTRLRCAFLPWLIYTLLSVFVGPRRVKRHSSWLRRGWQLLGSGQRVHPAVRQTGRRNRWGAGGYGPGQMNSPLDWRWPLCTSQRGCCSDTSLLHSNVWSEEKGTAGSDHHSAQLPPSCQHPLDRIVADMKHTLLLSQQSVRGEQCVWGWGIISGDSELCELKTFTCLPAGKGRNHQHFGEWKWESIGMTLLHWVFTLKEVLG